MRPSQLIASDVMTFGFTAAVGTPYFLNYLHFETYNVMLVFEIAKPKIAEN
ncbi:MAG: hypothetical protein KME05_07260 [Gloeocapsa sp. UFS-A4-WI-NPMV-4B04]|nr:hypothetical protein [Gloeocapsa sp. UFS-A4-WI-NPMV-4B04]